MEKVVTSILLPGRAELYVAEMRECRMAEVTVTLAIKNPRILNWLFLTVSSQGMSYLLNNRIT